MEKFEIIYRLKKASREVLFVIPSMLKSKPLEKVLLEEIPFPGLFEKGLAPNHRLYFRKYLLPFLPLGFFGRFLAKAVHFTNLTFIEMWKTGAMIANNLAELCVVRCDEGISGNKIDTQYSIIISVLSFRDIPPGNKLLIQQIVEIVESVISCHYSDKNKSDIQTVISCTHCILSRLNEKKVERLSLNFGRASGFLWMAEQAEVETETETKSKTTEWNFQELIRMFLTQDSKVTKCVRDKKPFIIPLEEIAPDITFYSIPLVEEVEVRRRLGKGEKN